ncbi:hypothetical protein [Phocaeicola vulgatus]|uniref:hypothetical protein n=1 Tax=Phocaeicola vulgatus TaxID=821 RepID=UPI003DA1DD5E
MKNYFIANGEVLNTNMSIKEMESRVQATLDENTSGMAQFRIKEVSEKEIRMFFVRDFDYDPNQPIIFDADMALITGLGIGAFQPQTVGGYPMIHPLSFAGKNFYSEITSFIRFYKFQLFEKTGQLVEHIGLRCYSDRILMQIIF